MTTFATETINSYNSNIAQIENQISQLQQLLSQQQSELQNIQSIEQMGESAISQIVKTLAACNHAGLPQLANSFKKQVIASLDEVVTGDAIAIMPAVDSTPQTPPPLEENTAVDTGDAVSDSDILKTIKALDEEHLTENYLPIYLYRDALPQLTRQQQDEILHRLEASDIIELSTLQEVNSYTPEQVKAGIKQDIGGPLFFIIVTDSKQSVQPVQSATKPAVSVGAAAAADVSLMDFTELKTYCLESLGLSKDDVRKHGKLTRRESWVSAIKAIN